MKNDIYLSYVIPSYNHARYIENVLDSIKNDGRTISYNYEIVIVDDGSSDASPDVIQRWIDNNKDISCKFHRQKNKGIAATLNKLYLLSEGEFVRPCSSDDLIIDGSSLSLLNKIREDVTCVFGDGILIDDNDVVISESSIEYHRGRKKNLSGDRVNEELIDRWCVAGPSLMLRKSFISTYTYDETSKIDDFDLFLTLLRTSAVQYVDTAVCKYRIHSTNTSKTKNVKARIDNIASFGRLISKHIELFPDGVLRNALIRQDKKNKAKYFFLRRKYFSACWCYLSFLLKHNISGL
ncbi:glycosyltransferase [Aeromonas veronii]